MTEMPNSDDRSIRVSTKSGTLLGTGVQTKVCNVVCFAYNHQIKTVLTLCYSTSYCILLILLYF